MTGQECKHIIIYNFGYERIDDFFKQYNIHRSTGFKWIQQNKIPKVFQDVIRYRLEAMRDER